MSFVSKVVAKISHNIELSKTKKELAKISEKVSEQTSKKLTGSLDALSASGRSLVKATKKGKVDNLIEATTKTGVPEKTERIKKLAIESIEAGVSKDAAIKGAKEIVAVTGEFSGEKAADSAMTFIESGLTDTEKRLNGLDAVKRNAQKQAERKNELKQKLIEKHGGEKELNAALEKMRADKQAKTDAKRIQALVDEVSKISDFYQ